MIEHGGLLWAFDLDDFSVTVGNGGYSWRSNDTDIHALVQSVIDNVGTSAGAALTLCDGLPDIMVRASLGALTASVEPDSVTSYVGVEIDASFGNLAASVELDSLTSYVDVEVGASLGNPSAAVSLDTLTSYVDVDAAASFGDASVAADAETVTSYVSVEVGASFGSLSADVEPDLALPVDVSIAASLGGLNVERFLASTLDLLVVDGATVPIASVAIPGQLAVQVFEDVDAQDVPQARTPRRLQASTDLLIDQWRSPRAPILNALIETLLVEFRAELAAVGALEQQWNVGTAEGVWLDLIGERLGLPRPSTVSQGEAFGFDDAGFAFDQRRMADDGIVQPRAPVGDVLYASLLRARGWALLSYGNAYYLENALLEMDPGSIMVDLDDMSFRVTTSRPADILLADQVRALPRPDGVRMIVEGVGQFGFDDAGVSFDQGSIRTSG